jgi:hypothetical protein
MTKWNFKKLSKPVPIDENMPDFSNAPFVLAKMEKAEKLIAEYGLPESFEKKIKAKNRKKPINSKTAGRKKS